LKIGFGVRHAFTANCSSSGLRSRSRASPSTWSNGGGRPARVSILISSGTDWTTNRTKRLAARVPKLDIFADSFVLRDDNGWHITEGGRQFLASLEAPLPIAAEPVQAPEADMTKQPRSPTLRLVVNNERQPPGGRQEGPSRRSAYPFSLAAEDSGRSSPLRWFGQEPAYLLT
jgi:hypothetical protein